MSKLRDRTRDPRSWALSLAVGLPFAVGTAQDGKSIVEILLVTLGAAVVGLTVACVALPEWKDARFPSWAGALVIILAGALGSFLILAAF